MIGRMIRQVFERPDSDYELASDAIAVKDKILVTRGVRYKRRIPDTNEKSVTEKGDPAEDIVDDGSPPLRRNPAAPVYTFTEKKRIRKDFGKRSSILDVPYLLAIQLDSYREFLQEGIIPGERLERGLHAAFESVFPIESYSGDAALEYGKKDKEGKYEKNYRLEKPLFDVGECRLRGMTYAGVVACDVATGPVREGDHGERAARQNRTQGQGREGAGSLHGRDSAHDRYRHLHHQRHGTGDRRAAPPFPRCVLRA